MIGNVLLIDCGTEQTGWIDGRVDFNSVIDSNSWRRTRNRYVERNNCLDLIVRLVLNFTVDD